MLGRNLLYFQTLLFKSVIVISLTVDNISSTLFDFIEERKLFEFIQIKS